jgi:alkyldihydroxyacetonephosphate synthase
LGDLDQALAPHGLMVGHDPYSQPIATVGGTISTSSVGYAAARYGPMAEQVLAVEVVLGDGTVIRTRPVAKAAGPSLFRLWAGAEGTLGIITEATLRVFPQPERRAYHAYRFPTFASGFTAVAEMYALGLRPALLDYGSDTDWAPPPESAYTSPLADEPCELLLVLEGFAESVAAEERRASGILRAAGGKRLAARHAREYWEHRHDSAHRFQRNRADGRRGWGGGGGNRRSETLHIALPVSAVLGFHEEVHGLAEAHRVHLRECAVWTHPGLFSIILATEAEGSEAAAEGVRGAADAVLERAQDLGGSMEYCHGVGVRLLHLMDRELGSAGELLRRLKASLDPAHVLNPGKLGLS